MRYTRLPVASERAVRAVVARYGLHDDPWSAVPIRQVVRDEGWFVRFSETLAGVYGLAVVYQGVKVMTLNAMVDRAFQRWAMAHEMGHVLCGHEGAAPQMCAPVAMQLHKQANWISARHEHEANVAAGILLIPDLLLDEGVAVEEIARVCEVPLDLVTYRLGVVRRGR